MSSHNEGDHGIETRSGTPHGDHMANARTEGYSGNPVRPSETITQFRHLVLPKLRWDPSCNRFTSAALALI